MKINIRQFKKRSDYINSQKHPATDLILWNYNHKCQFDRIWDKYTIMARGLITDLKGNIIARPFPKFFNLGEPGSEMKDLPAKNPKIYEKLDGSLGIQYYIGDKVFISTRGSFTSEQAIWATKWIQERFTKEDFKEGYTYLYEIIYPENRVVVDYKERKELVLLGVINNNTGKELSPVVEGINVGIAFPKVLNRSISDLMDSLEDLDGNDEGFVLNYGNNHKNFRVKMKGQEYLRLHRLITGFSTKSIWECLMNNQNLDEIIDRVPDEFMTWVKEKRKEMEDRYQDIDDRAHRIYEKVKTKKIRKDQALYIIKKDKAISAVVFAMLDNRSYNEIIWKMLRPKYELPFKENL